MSGLRSQLARHQPEHPATPEKLQEMATAAWHKYGIVLIRPDELNDTWLRAAVTNLANERHGKRDETDG